VPAEVSSFRVLATSASLAISASLPGSNQPLRTDLHGLCPTLIGKSR
jgi:hypothetical protein